MIFFDGDNCGDLIQHLRRYAPEDDEEWSVHVIVYIKRDRHISSSLMGFEERPWFSMLYSSSTCKNAVDHAISVAAASLDMRLRSYKDVWFIFVSEDDFVTEIKGDINSVNDRVCLSAKNTFQLDKHLEHNDVSMRRTSSKQKDKRDCNSEDSDNNDEDSENDRERQRERIERS